MIVLLCVLVLADSRLGNSKIVGTAKEKTRPCPGGLAPFLFKIHMFYVFLYFPTVSEPLARTEPCPTDKLVLA